MIDPDKISTKMISGIKETMLAAIDAASAETLPLFRSTLVVDNKLSDGFDPVTAADRNAELAIREIISARFPEHSIIAAARHELFMENDDIRGQVFAAFDAFITEQSS